MRDFLAECKCLGIIIPDLHGERPLGNSMIEDRRVEISSYAVAKAKADQASFGENESGIWPVWCVKFGEPSIAIKLLSGNEVREGRRMLTGFHASNKKIIKLRVRTDIRVKPDLQHPKTSTWESFFSVEQRV